MRLVIVPGTNRVGSRSVKLAKLLVPEYTALGCEVDLLELALGPEFLAPEAYKNPTPPVKALVDRFLAGDGAVFVIPEYNGSYPGVLKLFVDMLPDKVSFDHRPCAYVGIADGAFQGLRAVEHFQGVAGYRHAHNYPVRVFIGSSYKAFTEQGAIGDPKLWERLQAQAKGFVRFVEQVKRSGG
jgi:NAD(P)H-dependent FMN reductase